MTGGAPTAGAAASAGEPRFVVPFLRHPGFVGREDDLRAVHALLQKGEAVGLQPVAAAGMGGIGKTQLAVEYAYRHAADYPGGVYWVNAARDVPAAMAALAAEVRLFEPEAKESELQHRLMRAFVRFLDAHPEALVIFDNVEDPRSLRNETFGFIPAQLRCKVLFTTRRREGGFAAVTVSVLPEEKALELLGGKTGRPWRGAERAAAQEVCRMLGCLPLALALAGAFLERNPEVSVEGFRDRLTVEGALAAADDTELGDDDLPTRHAASVEATLRVDWEALAKLPGGGAAERRVLEAAALLGEAAELPKARLALLTGLAEKGETAGRAAPLGVALRRLGELSLVEELGEKALRLHPLVRAFAEKKVAGRAGRAAECAGKLGEALRDPGRLNDEVAARGVDAVLEDLRLGVRLSREGAVDGGWIERLLRVLDREAHCLRRWIPRERPEFLLQQLRNRAFEIGEDEGCRRAEDELAARGLGYLRERVRSGRESEALVRTLEGHTDWVTSVTMTPSGRWAVSASMDQTLKVWDLLSGQLVRTLEGHAVIATSVAVTPDGKWAVSASLDDTIKLWNVASGQLVRTLERPAGGVTGVALTADGRWAVSASSDTTLKVWDLGSGELVRTLEGHGARVTGVALTADGRRAVSTSDDTTLKVWELGSGALVRTLEGHADRVSAVALTADGRWAVSASDDATLKVWDLDEGQLVRTLAGHRRQVMGVAVTADGATVISASYDKTLRVWDLHSGRLVRTLEGHAHGVNGVAVTADGRRAVSASDDATLKVWDLGDSRVEAPARHQDEVRSVTATANGRWAVSGSADATLKVWDLDSGQLLRTLEGHTRELTGVAVTSDARWAISASADATLKVWDLERGQLVRTLEGHQAGVTGVAVTADGRRAVSASRDQTLHVWDLDDGRRLGILGGPPERKGGVTVSGVAMSADGKRVVSASYDKKLKVWNLDRAKPLRTLRGHTSWVYGVAVTANGRWAVSASEDRTLKVWDLTTGKLIRTLEGHAGEVTGVAVAASGRWAVSASEDRTLRIWDMNTGATVALMEAHAALHCCAFASERHILAGDATGALHFVDWLPPDARPSTAPPPPSPHGPSRPPPPIPDVIPKPPSLPPMLDTHTDILLVTVTKPETQAVLEAFGSAAPAAQSIDGRIYFDLGDIRGARVRLTRSEMGAGGLGGAQHAITKGIAALSPQAVIMVGIAFGIDDEKQQIGDILVSKQLRLYDLARVGTHDGDARLVLRGDKPHAATSLINRYESAEITWTGAAARFGTVLTGDKLVDNLDYRNELRGLDPEAIGGEMEGAGLYVACHDAKVDWILIKGICDWADGNKGEDKKARQALAAKNAAEFALHGLRFVEGGWSPRKGTSRAPAATPTLDAAAPPASPGTLPPLPPRRPWATPLSGAELKELSEALRSAFPARSALAQLVSFGLSMNLDAITSDRNSQTTTVFELLQAAEAGGWVDRLFDAAIEAAPGNAALRALALKRRA